MRKSFLALSALVTALVMSSPAGAEVRGGEITLSPFVGGYVFDGVQHMNASVATGLRLGYNLTNNWGVEGQFTYVPIESIISSDADKGYQYSLRGDVLYHLMPESRLVPFLALGGGWSLIDKRSVSPNQDATLDYGAGVKYFLNDMVALRGDVRHIFSFHPHTPNQKGVWENVEFTVGLALQFGMPQSAAPVVEVEKPREEVTAPAPVPVEMKPAPALVLPPAVGANEIILPGRLASPKASAAAPVPERVPVPPAPVSEGPTSWLAEKTDVPEGKIMVTGYKIVENALEILATERIRDYKVYTLVQPSRLVVDIKNGLNGFRANSILINRVGITTVRMEDGSDYLRIVLDAAEENLLPYRIEETEKGLKVIITKP
jgi:outer membrane beta-barrel protein